MTHPQQIAEILGGEKVLGRAVYTLADLNAVVIAGLPKASLRLAAERVAKNKRDAQALIYRMVPESTFKRRQRLSPAESERSERLARVIALAEFTWGDVDLARDWLNSPHYFLSGETPVRMAETEIGARQVEEILHRINYGIPA